MCFWLLPIDFFWCLTDSVAVWLRVIKFPYSTRQIFPILLDPSNHAQKHRKRETSPGFFQHCIFLLFYSYRLPRSYSRSHLHTYILALMLLPLLPLLLLLLWFYTKISTFTLRFFLRYLWQNLRQTSRRISESLADFGRLSETLGDVRQTSRQTSADFQLISNSLTETLWNSLTETQNLWQNLWQNLGEYTRRSDLLLITYKTFHPGYYSRFFCAGRAGHSESESE